MAGLVVQDWQWEFDGLLLGAGTPYAITAAPGFLDLSGVRANFTPRARQHGGFTEPHFGGGAVLDLEFNLSATDMPTFYAAVTALEAQTFPQPSTRPIWWRIPGHPLLTMGVQVLRRSIPVEPAYAGGLSVKAAVQFYAPDPLKYGQTLSVTTGLPAPTPGLPYPLAYPLPYGASSGGRISAANPGSADTTPVFTVAGPIDASGFRIGCIEDGTMLQYTGALDAGDCLVIDARSGAVVLNGTADRRALLSLVTWPSIPALLTRTYAFTALGLFQPASSLTTTWAPAFW